MEYKDKNLAYTDTPSEGALDELFEQIIKRLGIMTGVGMLECEQAELGETFPLWVLPEAAIIECFTNSLRNRFTLSATAVDKNGRTHHLKNASTERSILQWAKPTRCWYHQVFCDHKAFVFARSQEQPENSNSLSLSEVFISHMAEDVDKAISLVDHRFPKRVDVKMLTVPEYHIYAFWINQTRYGTRQRDPSDAILIINTLGNEYRSVNLRFLSPQEFLDWLVLEYLRREAAISPQAAVSVKPTTNYYGNLQPTNNIAQAYDKKGLAYKAKMELDYGANIIGLGHEVGVSHVLESSSEMTWSYDDTVADHGVAGGYGAVTSYEHKVEASQEEASQEKEVSHKATFGG